MRLIGVVILTFSFTLAPLAADAQEHKAGKVARIGVLCGTRCEGGAYDTFRAGLRDLGWVEGRNLVIESRGAGGQLDRLPELARELVALNPNLIVASGPQPSRAAKDATSVLPVVFVAVADPVRVGLVQSLARPGGNVTGVATLVPGGFMAKQLELLKEAVPRASRVATLGNPKNDVYRVTFPVEIPPTARALGLQIQILEVSEPGQLEGAIEAAVRERADALHVLGDPIFHSPPHRLPELAAKARLPAIYIIADLVRAGGLMSYGPDFTELFRRLASYVDRILRGAKPADLPVEQPTKFELVINLKTAKALGLTIPPSVLGRADQVIE
ncbi:MAG: ABC transporter substrate-binding protein [Candidatus Rokuibacteriota bacterium]|nr:MAG: ABC transporter substrate-binding protein [Candidatus Rokubacteria bacterium]